MVRGPGIETGLPKNYTTAGVDRLDVVAFGAFPTVSCKKWMDHEPGRRGLCQFSFSRSLLWPGASKLQTSLSSGGLRPTACVQLPVKWPRPHERNRSNVLPATRDFIKGQKDLFVVTLGVLRGPVITLCRSHPGIKPDRNRQHETVIVVSVFFTEIDSSGRAQKCAHWLQTSPGKKALSHYVASRLFDSRANALALLRSCIQKIRLFF